MGRLSGRTTPHRPFQVTKVTSRAARRGRAREERRVRCLVPARDWVPDRAPGRDPDQHRLPPVIEARVAETAPPIHSGQDNTWKFAKLENGVEIQVPLFVGPGEIVRIDVKSGRYLERVREKKRSA